MKKRGFYKIRHQNLVWDGSNKRNRLNKCKMSIPISERNKELAEKRLNKNHSMLNTKSELNLDREKLNTEILKAHSSSAKNILTIDICGDSYNPAISHPQHFNTIPDDNMNDSSKVKTTTTSGIENSDKSISLKADESRKNDCKKIKNNKSLVTESIIKDSKKTNSILSNKNNVPMNESVLKKKYEPQNKTKSMEEDKSISLHNKYCSKHISDKKLSDIKTLKVTKNPEQNKNSTELIKLEDVKSIDINRSTFDISRNKEDLDKRKNARGNEKNQTVWDTKYRQNKIKILPNDTQYRMNLLNKMKSNNKIINLTQRHKFANSINSILRPVKPKTQILNKSSEYQLLPKKSYVPILPSVNPTRNIAQQMCHQSNFVMDNTLFSKLMKSGTSHLNELLQNQNNSTSLLNISKDKPWNKIQLIKDINSATFNKTSMVSDLKNEIKSWKKYENLKKVVLESTSEIYQAIMNSRKIEKNTKNTIHTPKKKVQQKCSVISIPLLPNVDINKFKKKIRTKVKTNNLKNNEYMFSTMPDPTMALDVKFKKPLNYQITYNELVKKNEMLINQEKFKGIPEIWYHEQKNSFPPEEKSEVRDNLNNLSKENSIKKPEGKNVKLFVKNAKKISMENKKSWVRYMHQMNDESKQESSTGSDISTYPSGCLKKPEFIIEVLPLKDEHLTELKKLTQYVIRSPKTNKESLNPIIKRSDSIESMKPFLSDKFNKPSEKLESSIITEYKDTNLSTAICDNRKDEPASFSDLCKKKSGQISGSKHLMVNKKGQKESEKKHLNHKTHCALCNSALEQEHCLINGSFEGIEPKVNKNKLNNESTNEEVIEVIGDCSNKSLKLYNSGEFQSKRTIDNKTLNEIHCDSDSINFNKALNNNEKTFIFKSDQYSNNIKVEVCSNIIYEHPIQNNFNSLEVPKDNKTAAVEKKYPKLTDSIIHALENTPSENNLIQQNQQGLTPDTFKEIKPSPLKPSSQELHAVEISLSSSQLQLSDLEEPKKSEKTQIENLMKATPYNPEFRFNLKEDEHLNIYKTSGVLDERVNNSSSIKDCLSPRNINFPHSNSDQNKSIPCNNLENVSNVQTKIIGKEISNCSNNNNLAKQVHVPLLILSSDENNMRNRNLTSLETQTKVLETCLPTPQLNRSIENTMNAQQQSNSNKAENIDADINGLKFSSFMTKSSRENSSLKTSNKITFIENIKEFIRSSYNYFKLKNNECGILMDKVLSNSQHHSQDKNKINHNISDSFHEIDNISRQSISLPESNKQSYISSECIKPHLHQKQINNNIEGNKTKLLPFPVLKHEKENLSLTGNEFINFSKMLPVAPKDQCQKTSKELKYWIPNEEIAINYLKKVKNEKTAYRQNKVSKTENILGSSNHHTSSLNLVRDKGFENFSVNPLKQQRSFCNLNHKKSNMKFSSKNRSYSKKTKQRFAKANLMNIKNKLSGSHYSLSSRGPIDEIPHFLKMRENRSNSRITKNSSKLKKNHSHNLYSDVPLKLKETEESNLFKIVPFFPKLSDKSNPESYWLNYLSKSIYNEDKLARNEFLTYIKKRKLPLKLSLKNNN